MSDAGGANGGPSGALSAVAAEIETHVGQSGWDQRPALFAIVRAGQFVAGEPETAAMLGVDQSSDDALTPIEQEALPDGELDEALAQIGWPESVVGCALAQEIVILPPSAEAGLGPAESEAVLAAAAAHPERREARLVVAVLRDGSDVGMLRLRPVGDEQGDLLVGPDLAPNLTRALLATLVEE